MSVALRAVTVLAALVYFFAAAAHAGLIAVTGPIGAAAIVEAVLGLVLVAAAIGRLSPRLAYPVALVGTLFGLAIVLLRGLGGFDVAIHFVMLAILAVGFGLLFARS
jgi:hypothetical protein